MAYKIIYFIFIVRVNFFVIPFAATVTVILAVPFFLAVILTFFFVAATLTSFLPFFILYETFLTVVPFDVIFNVTDLLRASVIFDFPESFTILLLSAEGVTCASVPEGEDVGTAVADGVADGAADGAGVVEGDGDGAAGFALTFTLTESLISREYLLYIFTVVSPAILPVIIILSPDTDTLAIVESSHSADTPFSVASSGATT